MRKINLVILIATLLLPNSCNIIRNSQTNKLQKKVTIFHNSIFNTLTLLQKADTLCFNSLNNYTKDYRLYKSHKSMSINVGVYYSNMILSSILNNSKDLYDNIYSCNHLMERLGKLNKNGKGNSDLDFIIKRIKQNNNTDSIVKIINDSFKNDISFFIKNDRNMILSFISAGEWIETSYIITQVYISSSNKKVVSKILVNQNKSLVSIIRVLENYQNISSYGVFINELKDLDHSFKKINSINNENYQDNINDIIIKIVALRENISDYLNNL